ncbi:MAG: phosphate ABC transporter substrate-binding protein PstS [Thermoplasmata archaeon]|nr:phosphate ABC transporter substrate-binding protein PstS [Thermoplasmata archaeon]
MSANNASGTNPSGAGANAPSDADKSHLPKSSSSNHMALYAVVAIVIIVVAVVGAGAALGWFTKKSPSNCPAGSGQTIAAAGSTLAQPLMTLWASQYSCGSLEYNGVGSGAGVTDLSQKTVDFGASDAPLSATQVSALPSGSTVLTIPELVAGVAIIYDVSGVAKGLNLTGTVLAGIYLGTITNWNSSQITSINPGVKLPDANITVVERADSSGTTYVYTSWLSLENSSWKSKVGAATTVSWPTGVKESGSLGVAGTVKSDPNSIGYVDLAYAITNTLTYGAIQNPANTYVLPNETNTAAAAAQAGALPAANAEAGWDSVSILNEPGTTTYPIATFSYVMVYSDLGAVYGSSESQAHAQGVVAFLWWAVSTGQSYSSGLSYVPLPSNVVTSDETAISSIQYNGQALTSH